MKFITAVLAAALCMCAATLWAHGTNGSIVKSEGYCVTAFYNDGEPMNYSEVKITGPGSDTPFQIGRTDLLGCFMFKPGNPGPWSVEVLDGMGHRLALDLTVDAKAETSDNNGSNIVMYSPAEQAGKAVTGLSVIFGLCGILYGLRARRLIKNTDNSFKEP